MFVKATTDEPEWVKLIERRTKGGEVSRRKKLSVQQITAIRRYIRLGRQIDAIKRVRDWLDISLRDAIEVMQYEQKRAAAPEEGRDGRT